MKTINSLFILIIKAYKYIISPILGKNCRFYPTCSSYSIQAFKKHNTFHAIYLIFKRVIKCNPFGGSGYDPVP